MEVTVEAPKEAHPVLAVLHLRRRRSHRAPVIRTNKIPNGAALGRREKVGISRGYCPVVDRQQPPFGNSDDLSDKRQGYASCFDKRPIYAFRFTQATGYLNDDLPRRTAKL